MVDCDCGAETTGKWADVHSKGCASLAATISIGEHAGVRITRDGDWVIIYTTDGGGGVTTISLTVSQALSMAELLKGSAITAARIKC